MKIIRRIEDIEENDSLLFGQKAQNIWVMYKNKIKVPSTLMVAYAKTWEKEKTVPEALAEIENEINSYFGKNKQLIVRSSYVNEDSHGSSMAGIFVSKKVDSVCEVKEAVCEVWESAGDKWKDMGIVIQEYIEADFSGILFSSDPRSNKSKAVIEMTRGKCEKLAKGNITPDVFVEEKGWTRARPDYIEDETAVHILHKAKMIKRIMKTEVDIEFGVKNQEIYFFQCRPITTKKEKSLLRHEEKSGTWILQAELGKPFTPLIRTMDPSGILTERPHIFLNSYAYFSSEYRLPKRKDMEWRNWEAIALKYHEIFQNILGRKEETDIELLEYAVSMFRNVVKAYMNVDWFIYRGTIYKELTAALKEFYGDGYEKKLFQLIRNIPTLNTQKRKDFIELLQAEGAAFQEKKQRFLQNYGAETAYPLYIKGECLEDYLETIIEIVRRKTIDLETVEGQENECGYGQTEKIRGLIQQYREVIKRTEDDDYLLCYGAYVIRALLGEIEVQSGLEKDTVYFYNYRELENLLQSKEKVVEEELKVRKAEYEKSVKTDMPKLIKNGEAVFAFPAEKTVLQGETVSSGKAAGKIYVIKNPGDILEILTIPQGSIVYSDWISPMMSSYFFNIKGIILTEKSVLSHGAILAREMSIPAVGGIVAELRTGMRVELDADEGKVTLLEEQ